nr:hypothetical protein [Streptomyces sp. NRRL F-4474]
MPLVQVAADLLGVAADRDRAVLVHDRTVVRQPVDLVAGGRRTDLGHHQLHLVRLLTGTREDRAEGLRVHVGQPTGRHIVTVVGVSAQIRVAHPADPQVLVLVVLAGGREADPVVDLAELVQRTRGVLADEHDAVGVLQHDKAATAGDALPGVFRPVGHGLLG